METKTIENILVPIFGIGYLIGLVLFLLISNAQGVKEAHPLLSMIYQNVGALLFAFPGFLFAVGHLIHQKLHKEELDMKQRNDESNERYESERIYEKKERIKKKRTNYFATFVVVLGVLTLGLGFFINT